MSNNKKNIVYMRDEKMLYHHKKHYAHWVHNLFIKYLYINSFGEYLAFFVQHLLKIRIIPSPAKQT